MERKPILEGVNVAEFTFGATGPLVGRELSAHGAEVIRVESHRRIDITRIASPYKDNIL